MRYNTIARSLFMLGFMIFSGGCIATKTPHENFKSFMNSDLGKKADDPQALIKRYSDRASGKTVLANGNLEIQFRAVKDCMVYFEVASKSNVIVNWRFEGTEKTCRINP